MYGAQLLILSPSIFRVVPKELKITANQAIVELLTTVYRLLYTACTINSPQMEKGCITIS